jgi:mono/diheme cytochrome c family protein
LVVRLVIWFAIVAAAVLLGVLAWWQFFPHPSAPTAAARLASGKTNYDAQCAACHGANLEGQPDWRNRLPNGRLPAPPHDASGHTWHHADQDLFALTKHGLAPFAPPGYQSDMPAFAGTLTDQEIRDVLAYIKSTWPPEIQAQQTGITQKSRRD